MGAVALPREIAVDLGSARTKVFVRGHGVVVDEPSVAIVDVRSGDVVEYGNPALNEPADDSGRFEQVSFMRNGAVDSPLVAGQFLSRLIHPYVGRFAERTRMVMCVPSSTTDVERRAIEQVAKKAGASNVYLIEQLMAAALGNDLPVHEPVGTMIVAVGAGTTEVAMLSLGSVVAIGGVRRGSAHLDVEIREMLRREYGMDISRQAAEQVKIALSGLSSDGSMMIEAAGRQLVDGSAMTAIMSPSEVQPFLDNYLHAVVEATRECLVASPPELAQDLFTRGVYLAGAPAANPKLSARLCDEFGLPIKVMNESATAAVTGAGKCLEALESLRGLFVPEAAF